VLKNRNDFAAVYATTRRAAARLTRPWLVGPLLFICILSGYLLSYNVDKPTHNADWYIRYTVTCTIVEQNTFAIHPYREDGRTGLGVGGKMYAQYTLGQTTAMIPLYLLGRRLAGLAHTDCAAPVAPPIVLLTCKLLDPILGALLAVLFYATARLLAYRRRVALALTALLAFGSSLWPDVLSNEEHTMESLFLLAAAYAALRYTLESKVASRKSKVGRFESKVASRKSKVGRLWLVAMGLAAGLVFVTRVAGVIALPLLALYLVALHRRVESRKSQVESGTVIASQQQVVDSEVSLHGRIRALRPHFRLSLSTFTFDFRLATFDFRPLARDLALFGLGALPAVVVNAVYDAARFGSPLLTNPPTKPDQSLGFPPWLGLPDLLISPGKGLLWYTPAVLLLILAARPFWRRCPLPATLFALICGGYLLFYSNVNYWHGDPAWGPRYLYATLPYLILPLGEVFGRWRTYRLPLRGVLVGVLAASLLVQFSAVSVSYWRHWHYIYGYHYDQVENHSWGQNLNYFWAPEQSPVLLSLTGIADITQKYVDHAPLVQHPAADRLSNPDESCGFRLYGQQASICLTDLDDLRYDANWNTFTMWWVHVYPWWPERTVVVLALALLGVFLASGAALVLLLNLTAGATGDAFGESEALPAGYGGARASQVRQESNGHGDNGNGHGKTEALDIAALPRLDVTQPLDTPPPASGSRAEGPGGGSGTLVRTPPTPRIAARTRTVAPAAIAGLAPLGLAAVVAALAYGGIMDAAALTAPRQAPPLIHHVSRNTTVRDGAWTYRVLGVTATPALPGGIDLPPFGHHYVVVRLRLFNHLTRPHHVRIENFALTDDAGLSYPDMYITDSDFRAEAAELYHGVPFGMQVPARSAADDTLVFLVRNGAQHLKLLGPGVALVDLNQS